MPKHNPFSQNRWLDSIKIELEAMRTSDLSAAQVKKDLQPLRNKYMPLILPVARHLEKDSQILEIGCGINCIAQFIELGKKTYLDPLLDDFKKKWPGLLPQGEFMPSVAEAIKKSDQSYDLILCINAISHTQNPELVLHEMERLLKPDGTVILCVTTWPSLFARLHYFTARIYPQRILRTRLYCYTRHGIERSLKRHFHIQSSQMIDQPVWQLSKEWFYVCKPMGEND
ncbi:MAG: hypothetical protein CO186_08795 [Zetaproteobacteria bacterium CG_4_9_14_3_um_filter_49_83]|nr:MAG: hypothetical protein AUJ56_04340 [Zetaproteobacteria bacterium CG1_02_49_23]PIQ31640.1 MAG: hypothetical protein COW62_09140 [Zetaproteobacteria bacterium CG17_big_fil_post_rev_8_21_14_2_50_50_13]PIV31119.1 MAG: hypothetical protein COS35_03080 [Zetaproteobacteria bacterium CG02_land_8_20_14_3_00_50_9]PIY55506.1 MAG: hypothetical protein COZ00_09045 [Zetaproteobacteria bacterium CG_4_10_14_0_8_um_filter_49_80]PJA34862.1 MAG: hypothetical protein CO186_08795 [Zetaproteobacteria bacterium